MTVRPAQGCKPCISCGEIKPLEAFYRHSRMADGRLNKCAECSRAYQAQYREASSTYIRAYDRERNKTEDRRKKREAYRRSENYKSRLAKWKAKWAGMNRQKTWCHQQVASAIKRGDIAPEPCFFCQSEDRLQAHHPNYDKPLDVFWLCVTCHNKLHVVNGDKCRGAQK